MTLLKRLSPETAQRVLDTAKNASYVGLGEAEFREIIRHGVPKKLLTRATTALDEAAMLSDRDKKHPRFEPRADFVDALRAAIAEQGFVKTLAASLLLTTPFPSAPGDQFL